MKCKVNPDCKNTAFFTCDLCHDEKKQACLTCCFSAQESIISNYVNTFIYCGCSVEIEEMRYSESAVQYLDKLNAACSNENREFYLMEMQKQMILVKTELQKSS